MQYFKVSLSLYLMIGYIISFLPGSITVSPNWQVFIGVIVFAVTLVLDFVYEKNSKGGGSNVA